MPELSDKVSDDIPQDIVEATKEAVKGMLRDARTPLNVKMTMPPDVLMEHIARAIMADRRTRPPASSMEGWRTVPENAACAKCRYWADKDREASWDASAVNMRKCNAVRERWEIQDEASKGIPWSSDEGENSYTAVRSAALSAARAYVEDGSEYHADLVTGPDFSCALFEPAIPSSPIPPEVMK